MVSLYGLIEATVLFLNALAILHERRFLAKCISFSLARVRAQRIDVRLLRSASISFSLVLDLALSSFPAEFYFIVGIYYCVFSKAFCLDCRGWSFLVSRAFRASFSS